MNVTLNEAEQKLAQYLAKKRYLSQRANGVANMKMGPQSNEETDLEGISGEIAFCKLFNCYPDLTGEPGPYDTWMKDAGSVDVKTTHYERGRLLAVKHKDETPLPDIYALMIGKFPEYRFAGWAWAFDLIDPDRLTDLGHGPTYCLEQNELNEHF
jgi:hypothetical protein